MGNFRKIHKDLKKDLDGKEPESEGWGKHLQLHQLIQGLLKIKDLEIKMEKTQDKQGINNKTKLFV